MLVLTRGLKQQIVIGDQQITVTVLEVKGGRVRLGIEAPPDVAVRRKELLEPKQPCLELELATAE
ncbi:MAG: carbon storage regulator [Candidatus Saccharimonas sp.]|nr:carbon storage regulator [Planctomycetaceae bacterium]